MERSNGRFTYANVASSIAVVLIVILGAVTISKSEAVGTAEVGTDQLKAGSVTTDKLAKDLVVPAADKLAHYANISEDGTVLDESQGITQNNVTHKSNTSTYCISGFEPAPVGGLATVDYSESEHANVDIQFDLGRGRYCPAGTQAYVSTFTVFTENNIPVHGGPDEAGFFLILY